MSDPDEVMAEPNEVIHLTSETTALIIHMLGRYIYSPGVDETEYLDPTHEQQMGVLNLLIKKLHQSIKARISKENWDRLESTHERIVERVSDEGKI